MRKASLLVQGQGQHDTADRLLQASTHWLRHTSLTHQIDAGVPLKTAQLNSRHSSLATTGRYVYKEHAVRHAETIAALFITPR